MTAVLEEAAPAREILQRYLVERQIRDSLADEISSLSDQQADIVSEIVERLKPSANTLRDILRFVREICQRDQISWSTVFSDELPQRLLDSSSQLGPKDRQKELKRFLERKRFPETAEIENKLSELRKQLAKDSGLSVELPQDLEGDELRLTISFSSPQNLAVRTQQVQRLSEHPALAEIFRLLMGER